jgi:hypothetical protein
MMAMRGGVVTVNPDIGLIAVLMQMTHLQHVPMAAITIADAHSPRISQHPRLSQKVGR